MTYWFRDICLLTSKFWVPVDSIMFVRYPKLGCFYLSLISFSWNLDSVMRFRVLWRPRFCRRCHRLDYTPTRHSELPVLVIRPPVSINWKHACGREYCPTSLFSFCNVLTNTLCYSRYFGPFPFCSLPEFGSLTFYLMPLYRIFSEKRHYFSGIAA